MRNYLWPDISILHGGTDMIWAWAQLMSYVAGILGFLVAIFGGIVALRAYIFNTRAAANTQMHTLFRDYLRLRFDYSTRDAGKGAAIGQLNETILAQLTGLKLYALEEMYLWIRREEHYLRF